MKIVNCKLKILLIVLLLQLLLIVPVYAQDDGLGQSHITPASPLYFLKSIREIVELRFAGATHIRALRELEFATRRVREIKSLAVDRQDLIEPALYQYLSHLEEFIGKANLKEPDFAAKVSREISMQMGVLQSIYTIVSDKRALMSIRATVNNLADRQLEIIKKLKTVEQAAPAEAVNISRLSACTFLRQEASASALNEVERVVLTDRANACFKKDAGILSKPGV